MGTPLLLDAHDVELERGVPVLHDVATRGRVERHVSRISSTRNDVVPAARTELQIHSRRIQQHRVVGSASTTQARIGDGSRVRRLAQRDLKMLNVIAVSLDTSNGAPDQSHVSTSPSIERLRMPTA